MASITALVAYALFVKTILSSTHSSTTVDRQYWLIDSFPYEQSVRLCALRGGDLVLFVDNEYGVCCSGCEEDDDEQGCYQDQSTVFQHKWSQNMEDIEAFINEMSPSSVTRIFGGVSYPDLHVWVANDTSGKEYDFHLTDWSLGEFVGTNQDIDTATDAVMIFGFKPTPSPYNYWVEERQNSITLTRCVEQTTLFQHKWSQNMEEIEAFINEMSPSSVTRIFGGVSYPDLHVWVANDASGKQFTFHLTGWSLGEFVGTNQDIDIANDKVMIIDFKPTPSPYAYWVEEVTSSSAADAIRSLDQLDAFGNNMQDLEMSSPAVKYAALGVAVMVLCNMVICLDWMYTKFTMHSKYTKVDYVSEQ